MENASKALLIAAAVLVAIILITIGIKVYTSTSGVDKVASSTGQSIISKTGEAAGLATSEITGPATWKYKNNDTIVSTTGQELNIGDYIAYDHTKDKNGNEINESTGLDKSLKQYTDGWQVFGIDNGKIQLISAKSVGKIRMTSPDSNKINSIAAIYGKGKGAESGRSINVDDINRITGYNPNNPSKENKYGLGNIWEYGNKVTYYWDSNDFPYYTDGTRTGYSDGYKNSGARKGNFQWWDENGQYHSSQKNSNITYTDDNKQKIITLTSTYYFYSIPNYLQYNTNRLMYNLICNSDQYWLSSAYAFIQNNYVNYGLFCVYGTNLTDNMHSYSQIGVNSPGIAGVRPLITLSGKTKITKNSSNDGSSISKACILN